MDFIFHPNGLGLREKGKWYKIVDIEECAIANEEINKLLREVRNFNFKDTFDVKKHTGTMRYAVIRAPRLSTSISFVLNSESSRIKDAVDEIRKFAQKTSAENVAVTYVKPNTDVSISDDYFIVKGSDMLKEEYLGKKFLFHIQGFFQNNTEMAEEMHRHCHALLKKYNTKSMKLVDLYGGVGTFGIINADLFRNAKIIENSEQCISAAEKNIELNNIKNTEAIVMDTKQIGKLSFSEKSMFIIDPPRSGMHPKALRAVNEIRPERIIYISCNPKQLSKELPRFKDYSIKSTALFDLFPQTPHSEAVVELERANS